MHLLSDHRPIARGVARGVVGAMAMTGMRTITKAAGWVEETPPEALANERGPTAVQTAPKHQRREIVELLHWGYGALGGAVFGSLPAGVRHTRWAGPVYGLALWLAFEAGIAPGLGLSHAKGTRLPERLAFAADHLLYGAVLTETSPRLP